MVAGILIQKVPKSIENEKMKMAETSPNVKCIKQFKFFLILTSFLVQKNITWRILDFDARIYRGFPWWPFWWFLAPEPYVKSSYVLNSYLKCVFLSFWSLIVCIIYMKVHFRRYRCIFVPISASQFANLLNFTHFEIVISNNGKTQKNIFCRLFVFSVILRHNL